MCFYGAMKHKNDVSDMIGCLQVVRIYSFKKEMKFRERLWKFSSRWKPAMICSRIFPNVCLGFYQAIEAQRKRFIS